MKKIIISEDGRVGFIDGPGAKGLTLEFTHEDKVDPTKEEINASKIDTKTWDRLRKEKNRKKVLSQIKKLAG